MNSPACFSHRASASVHNRERFMTWIVALSALCRPLNGVIGGGANLFARRAAVTSLGRSFLQIGGGALSRSRRQARYPPLSVGRSRFSNFGLALDFRLSLGLGRRATPEPADHTDCRHAD